MRDITPKTKRETILIIVGVLMAVSGLVFMPSGTLRPGTFLADIGILAGGAIAIRGIAIRRAAASGEESGGQKGRFDYPVLRSRATSRHDFRWRQ